MLLIGLFLANAYFFDQSNALARGAAFAAAVLWQAARFQPKPPQPRSFWLTAFIVAFPAALWSLALVALLATTQLADFLNERSGLEVLIAEYFNALFVTIVGATAGAFYLHLIKKKNGR